MPVLGSAKLGSSGTCKEQQTSYLYQAQWGVDIEEKRNCHVLAERILLLSLVFRRNVKERNYHVPARTNCLLEDPRCRLKRPLRPSHFCSFHYLGIKHTGAFTGLAEMHIFCDRSERSPFPTSTKSLISPYEWYIATSSGSVLAVKRRYRILDLCTNPWSFSGRNLD